MLMAIFKSVFGASLSSAMIFISIIRLGMLAYPAMPTDLDYTTAQTPTGAIEAPVAQSRIVSTATKRHIVMGQNSIKNLGKSK